MLRLLQRRIIDISVCPWASVFEKKKNNCNLRTQVIATDIWFKCSSSMWGIFLNCLSLRFLESTVIFTNLSFFTMFTIGDTEQTSSMLFAFSKCPALLKFSGFLPTSACECSGISVSFCLTRLCSNLSCIFICVSFITRLFSNGSPIFHKILSSLSLFLSLSLSLSEWLFSTNCILPIVSLILLIQSNSKPDNQRCFHPQFSFMFVYVLSSV